MKFPYIRRSRLVAEVSRLQHQIDKSRATAEGEINNTRRLQLKLEELQRIAVPAAPLNDHTTDYQPRVCQTDMAFVQIEETWSDDLKVGLRGFVLVKQGSPQDMEITLAGQPPLALQWEDRPDVLLHDVFSSYEKHVRCGFHALFQRRAPHATTFTLPSGKGRASQQMDLLATGYAPIPKTEPDALEVEEFAGLVNRECSSVLEIGSRVVSPGSMSKRSLFAPHIKYTGFDIYPDANTDVVGDAHALSHYFPKDTKFDAIFSLVVLEHTAMPWMIAMEINKLLPVGGLSFHQVPFTCPLHETPWDFWRFTHEGLRMLFSPALGFELISFGLSGPCRVHVEAENSSASHNPFHPTFGGSSILVRKTRDYDPEAFRWNTSLQDVLPPDSAYPLRQSAGH